MNVLNILNNIEGNERPMPMRILIEKFRDAVKDFRIIFIDLKKSFDTTPCVWTVLHTFTSTRAMFPNYNVTYIYKDVSDNMRCTSGASAPFFLCYLEYTKTAY